MDYRRGFAYMRVWWIIEIAPPFFRDNLERLHDNLVRLLETEFSIARVFTQVARTHYSRGDQRKGDNAKQAAEKALAAIHHFAESSGFIDDATRQSMQRRWAALKRHIGCRPELRKPIFHRKTQLAMVNLWNMGTSAGGEEV